MTELTIYSTFNGIESKRKEIYPHEIAMKKADYYENDMTVDRIVIRKGVR